MSEEWRDWQKQVVALQEQVSTLLLNLAAAQQAQRDAEAERDGQAKACEHEVADGERSHYGEGDVEECMKCHALIVLRWVPAERGVGGSIRVRAEVSHLRQVRQDVDV